MTKAVFGRSATVLVVLVGLTVGAVMARAEDWPQWRGPMRTGHVAAGVAVPKGLPETPVVVWKAPLGNGLSSPVVAGGRVFILDNQQNKEVAHAFDAATGKEAWAAPIDEAFKDSQSTPGPRCTPVADGAERVFVQSCRGELQCLSAADGKVVWRTNFVKDFGAIFIGESGPAEGARRHGNTGSPMIEGEHLIAEVGGKGAAVVCFEKATGKVVWKAGEDIPAYAAPMIADLGGVRQVVAFMSQAVIGMDVKTGALLWRVPVKTALGRHVTTPIVAGDMVLVASHQAGLMGIKVTKEGEGFKADKAWTEKATAINFSSPVVVGQHLYGVGPGKNVVCVEVATGKLAWSKDGLFGGNAGNAHAGMIVMGENILMLSDRGELTLFAADPAAFKQVGRAQVSGQNWCNPAYAGGKVYLRDAKELRCVGVIE